MSSQVSSRADSFMLAAFRGPAAVGAYTAVKIFTRAYDMVTQVVQMFLLPAASQISTRGEQSELKATVEKSLLFSILAMLPVMAAFIVLANPFIRIVYMGRYLEMAPQLQIFGLMAMVVPVSAIASSVLMGIGEARAGFIIGIQALISSLVLYLIFIPWLGISGATVGYVLSSIVVCFLSLRIMGRHVTIKPGEVLRRWGDIDMFVRRAMRKLRGFPTETRQ